MQESLPDRKMRLPKSVVTSLTTALDNGTLSVSDRELVVRVLMDGAATANDAYSLLGLSERALNTNLTLSQEDTKSWFVKLSTRAGLIAAGFTPSDDLEYFATGDSEDTPMVTGLIAVTEDEKVLVWGEGEFSESEESLESFEAPFIVEISDDDAELLAEWIDNGREGGTFDLLATDPEEAALVSLAMSELDLEYLSMVEAVIADATGYSRTERSRNAQKQRRNNAGQFAPSSRGRVRSREETPFEMSRRLHNWHRARLSRILPRILKPGVNISEWVQSNPMLWNHRRLHPFIASAGDGEFNVEEPIIAAIPVDSGTPLGPEESHITLVYMNDVSSSSLEDIKAAAERVASSVSGPISIPVTGRDTLGEHNADVLMLDNSTLVEIRNSLLDDETVKAGYDAAEQYPDYTAHLTLGYPEDEYDPEEIEAPEELIIDRLAVWAGDNRYEFFLGSPEAVTADASEDTDTDAEVEGDASAPEAEGDEPTDLYFAVVDEHEQTAVLDVVAIVPDEDGEPTAWVRRSGEWESAPDLLAEMQSSTPPAVVQLAEEDEIIDILQQVDDFDAGKRPDTEEETESEVPEGEETLADYSKKQRENDAERGFALEDGSYPIRDIADLKNAVQAYGRTTEEKRPKVREHIRKRARALNRTDLVPDNWKDLAVADFQTVYQESNALYGEFGEVITAAGVPGIADTPSDWRAVERLRQYWAYGKGAAKIRWGTPGDLTRCHRRLSKYMPGRAWGYCNNLHKRIFGIWNPRD